MISRSPRTRRHTLSANVRGILWMMLTVFFMGSSDPVMKLLAETYPVPKVVWGRSLFFALLVVVVFRRRLTTILATRRLGLQLTRSSLQLAFTVIFFLALSLMPIADANALLFAGPLLVTALSGPMLGEHVGVRRWVGIAIGFLGALVIIRPGSGVFQSVALLPVAAACCMALFQILTRRVSDTDSAATSYTYTIVVGVVASSIWVPFFWQTPDLEGWLMMAALGLLTGAGQYTYVRAFQAAPASTVAPYFYAILLWATIYGYLIFDHLPDAWTISGAAVIVAAGVYNFHRECRRTERDDRR